MMRLLTACIVATLGIGVRAAPVPDLSGTWTLNRTTSDLPKEAGFDPDYHESASAGGRSGGSSGGSSGGGARSSRGGRGGGGASGGSAGGSGAISTLFESPEDTQKIKQLVTEVTHPPDVMTVTQSSGELIIADADGKSRTYRITGREETVQLEAGPIAVVTKWDGAQLLIRYLVEKNRELRIVLSRAPDAHRLLMTAQFAEKGRGEIIKRVYE